MCVLTKASVLVLIILSTSVSRAENQITVLSAPTTRESAAAKASPVFEAAQGDHRAVQALIEARAAAQISRRPDGNLYFLGTLLPRVNSGQSIEDISKVYDGNGQARELVTDRQMVTTTAEAAKRRFPALSEQIDAGRDWVITEIDKQGGGSVPNSHVPAEIQVGVLIENLNKLPVERREAAYRKVATILGVDYDSLLQKAEEQRILDPGGDGSSINNVIVQEETNYHLGVGKEALNKTEEMVAELGDRIGAFEEQADRQTRQDALDLEISRLQAGTQMAGYILEPLIGSEETRKITGVANSAIEIHRALEQFGPGGITADNLLMCTNIVSAGLLAAQILSGPQEDPTMKMLKSMMEQLKQIKEQLDRIEGKVDTLSDVVLQGFNLVLDRQAFATNQLLDLKRSFIQAENREAILLANQEFLTYVETRDDHIRDFSTNCANNDRNFVMNVQACRHQLAADLAVAAVYTDVEVSGTPKLATNVYANRTFSTGAEIATAVMIEQLSKPLFFTYSPNSMWSMVARNHEALAALSNKFLATRHTTPLTSPEVLAMEIDALLESTRQNGEIVRNDRQAPRLIGEAQQRIKDIETFIALTVGSETYMANLWKMLGESITNYQTLVEAHRQQIFTAPSPAEMLNYRGRYMFGCDQLETADKISERNGPRPRLSTERFFGTGQMIAAPAEVLASALKTEPDLAVPAAHLEKSVESLVGYELWIAQRLGFVRLGYCYDIAFDLENSYFNGNSAFYGLNFRIRSYAVPTPKATGASNEIAVALDDDRATLVPSAIVYDLRSIRAANLVGTWGQSFSSAVGQAWHIGPGPHDYAGYGQPAINAFMPHSFDHIGREQRQRQIEKVAKLISEEWKKALRNRSKAWDPARLLLVEPEASRFFTEFSMMTDPQLEVAMQNYTFLHLFAKTLLLTAAYHGNTVSECLAELDLFAPEALINGIASEGPWGPAAKFSGRLTRSMDPRNMGGVGKKCVATRFLNSQLTLQKKELADIQTKLQVIAPPN